MQKMVISKIFLTVLSFASLLVWSANGTAASTTSSIFNITIDTSSLQGTSASLAFDFLNNNADAPNANAVTISSFQTDGVFDTSLTDNVGSVSGTLNDVATFSSITDGFNELFQPITLGSFLQFQLNIISLLDLHESDSFQLNIFNGLGTASLVPTLDPLGTDILFEVNFLPNISFTSFTDLVSAEQVVSAVPVPGAFSLMLLALGAWGGLVKSKQRFVLK
ncbi:MAG: NF038129 family PEP-CTERM protein [Methylococcaceae bacterium]|jgi:hypothetical protein